MPRGPIWTETEKQLLRDHYAAIQNARLREILPTRTERAIADMAKRIGYKKCHERLREMGAENIRCRPDRRAIEA